MNNWDETDDSGVCTATADYQDAKRTAEQIGIPFYSVSFAKEYFARVFSYFLDEYKKGRTPNPDILCNSQIKFNSFLQLAMNMDAELLATGHYARLAKNGGVKLLRAHDTSKDQTYFLAALNSQQLANAMFPIGDMDKAQVRRLAAKHGLITAQKKDSTGICFIGERKFKEFLMQFLPAQKGDIVSIDGRRIGRHDGLMYYTLGQRRGLGIGGMNTGTGESWFVVGKDLSDNLLIVCQGEREELYSVSLKTDKLNFIASKPPSKHFKCTAKFRYRQSDQGVTVDLDDDGGAHITFDSPQRAVTPGQWVVLYDADECLGGGAIDSVKPLKPLPDCFKT